MSPEVAATVHYAILAVATAFWLLALGTHLRTFRPVDPREPDLIRRTAIEVDATPDRVAEKALESLRTAWMPGLGPVALERADLDRIAGEATVVTRKGAPRRFGFAVEFRDSVSGGGTEAALEIRARSRGLQTASKLFVFFLAPLALVGVAALAQAVILGSESPAVRAQAIQTIHAGHLVWPPFLLAAVWRRQARLIEQALAAVLKNAAF